MMKPEQCRMARAAVGLSIAELASACGVRDMTISGFERGADSRRSTIDKLQSELERRGVVFISAGEASLSGGVGARVNS